MSHYTSFIFQYTKRDLILKTFNALNLDTEDGFVNFYKSNLFKNLKIGGKNKTPAICSEKNGFNYFMLDRGNYYELLVEKHNLTQEDIRTSKKMAADFQKEYVKQSALEMIKAMEAKGNSCMLSTTSSGFEILFGSTYEKKITIDITADGNIKEEVFGIKGSGCQTITQALEDMLSSKDAELNTTWTQEYHELATQDMLVYKL